MAAIYDIPNVYICIYLNAWGGALVQLLKLWHSSFKETIVFSLLTRKESILWGISVTER